MGTGKIHTLLGTKESLHSDDENPDWGIFPRINYTVPNRIKRLTLPDPP